MSIKKLFIGLAVVALALSATVSFVGAQTLTAQQLIDMLTSNPALLAQVLANLNSPAATPGMMITQQLAVGSRGAQVTALQNFLIGKDFSIPAGPTGYFGQQTKAAVMAFQTANSISPVGQVGPQTRAAINAMMGTTGGGAASCPAGQFNPLTGQPCGSTSTLPAGCTSTSGYSITTGTKCDSTPVGGGSTISEGSITASVASIPVDDANIRSSTGVSIYGLEVDAIGSDMTVDRFDIQMSVIPSGGSAQNPASFIKKLSFYDGSTLLKEMSLSSSDFNKDSSDRYHVIVSGLGFKVPKGTTKIMTIKADVAAIDTADVNRAVTIKGYAGNTNNVRAADTAGFQSYADVSAAADTRSHTFKPAGDASVTITANSSKTPKSNNNRVNSTTGVSKLTMLAVNVKAETGDAIITKVYASSSATSSAGYPNTLYLFEEGGTEPIATVADGATKGTVVFSSLKINVPKDTTKVLLIKADFPTTASGQAASTTLPVNAVQWEKPGGSTASTSNTAVINSNDQYLFGRAPKFTLNGTPSVSKDVESGTTLSTTTLTFKIPVKLEGLGGNAVKPVAGDFILYIASTTATSTVTRAGLLQYNGYSPMGDYGNAYVATTTAMPAATMLASTTVTLDTPDPNNDTSDSYSFTLTGTIKNRTEFGKIIGATVLTGGTNSAGNYRMILVAASSTVDGFALTNQTWGLTSFETPSAFLPGS